MNIEVDRSLVYTPWFLRIVIIWAFKSSILAGIKEKLAQGLFNRTSGKRVRLYMLVLPLTSIVSKVNANLFWGKVSIGLGSESKPAMILSLSQYSRENP